MSKRLILLLALAFVVGISFATYAEVQNVKVSGDLSISGVYRNNFDLAKSTRESTGRADREEDILSIARVRVDADLTDNVAVVVRLLNERNWNGDSAYGTEANRNIGLADVDEAENENDIDLDLAYVTLKEFLYSPLTVTVGRQLLRFGNGWIVGDPDTNGVALASELAEGDLSSRKSFDAVRTTLDYNPLIVDIIYAKIAENNTVLNNDTTLSGINAAYELDKNTTLEGFFFSKIKGSQATAVTNLEKNNATSFVNSLAVKDKADKVFTVGGRVVNKTVKNLSVDAQAAYQFGTYNPKFDPNAHYISNTVKAQTTNRSAWGAELIAAYDLKDIKAISKWKPSIAGAFVYLSGEDRYKVDTDDYKGWDGMYEDQTMGHILNAIMGFSNVKLMSIIAQAKPMDDLTVKLDYVRAWWSKRYPDNSLAILSGVSGAQQFRMQHKSYLGQEFDLTLTYDYTEDVQFSLLGGVFFPGTSINSKDAITTHHRQKVAATELIGSMKVTF